MGLNPIQIYSRFVLFFLILAIPSKPHLLSLQCDCSHEEVSQTLDKHSNACCIDCNFKLSDC
ncbi:hypothetical protein Golax_015070 [Gossypium laxum]|uniref:Uncharacterized protein n=1 Tax=Gossypium laxum TaxID=34288 RepID=A0A7J8ZWQ2_9ROSI|nr:hypothetical protein [Gossypium laxum]